VFNPVPGRVIYYMINTQVDNVDTRYFYEGAVLYSYNTSNLTMTERSALRTTQFVGDRPDNTGWDPLTVGGLSRTHQTSTLVSKVYKYEDSTFVRYTFFTLYNRNGGELYVKTLSYNKSSDSISVSQKRVASGLYTSLSNQIFPPGGTNRWYLSCFERDNTYLAFPHGGYFYYLRESMGTHSGSTVSGNLVLVFRGLPPYSFQAAIVLVPFTLSVDFSNYSNTAFSMSPSQRRVYGPFSVNTVFDESYVSSDLSKIEVKRSSTYSPPSDYAVKIGGVAIPFYNSLYLVINSDVDQPGRLSVTSILSTKIWNLGSMGGHVHVAGSAYITYELSENGDKYFIGSTFLEGYSPYKALLVSRHAAHKDIHLLSVVPIRRSWDYGISNFLVSFKSNLPRDVSWGSGLRERATQPYIARIRSNKLYSYSYSPSDSGQNASVFTRRDHFYLTSFIETNFDASGFFTPMFMVMKEGGDGIWFDRNKLYVGIETYLPDAGANEENLMTVVNGISTRLHRESSSAGRSYPSPVNSTISLVVKVALSPDRDNMSIIGIQGQNRLNFFNYSLFDHRVIYDRPDLMVNFGNVEIHTTNFWRGHIPLAPIRGYGDWVWNNAYTYYSSVSMKFHNVWRLPLTHNRPIYYLSRSGKEVFSSSLHTIPKGNDTVRYASPCSYVVRGTDDITTLSPSAILMTYYPGRIRAIDTSNTLVAGDYIQVTEESTGRTLKYVITETADMSVYNFPYEGSTQTRRVLEAVLVEVM